MIRCAVYRSERRPETYLYLAVDQAFEDLPSELQRAFGEPAFVMSLDLDGDRRLARVDVQEVMRRLAAEGYFLQLPPELPVEEEITRMVRRRE